MIDENIECAKCLKFAKLMCQNCREAYCSPECQVADWRVHKKACFPMPKLVPRRDESNVYGLHQKLANVAISEIQTKTEPKDWQKFLKPLNNGYFDVYVRFVEATGNKKIYWLCPVEQEGTLKQLMLRMQQTTRSAIPLALQEIQVGQLVIANHEQAHRGKIIKIDAQYNAAFIQRIDHGDKMKVGINVLYAAIHDMYVQKALVFSAVITNVHDGPRQDELITVCLQSPEATAEGHYCVQQKITAAAAVIIKVKVLKVHGMKSTFVFLDQPEMSDEYEGLQANLQTLKMNAQSSAFIAGKLVAAYYKKIWCRALLLSVKIVDNWNLVYLIDKGTVCFCEELSALPDIYVKQVPRVLIVKLAACAEQPTLNTTGTLAIANNDCVLQLENAEYSGLQIKPEQFFKEGAYGYWREGIDSGSSVVMTCIQSPNEVWTSASDLVLLRKVITKLAEQCKPLNSNADDYQSRILVARINAYESDKNSLFDTQGKPLGCNADDCLSRYSQSYLIRGTVTSKEGNIVEICNVDTGVKHHVKTTDLLEITPLIRALPAQLAFITFEMPGPINKNAEKTVYSSLGKLLMDKIPLRLQENAKKPSKPELIFYEGNVTCNLTSMLYAEVNKKDEQIKKKLYDDEPALMIKDEEKSIIKKLTKINIPDGDMITLFVIDTSELSTKKTIVAAYLECSKTIKAIAEQTELLAKYCATNAKSRKGYTPVLQEICLAIFSEDQEWYRARCLKILPNDNFLVEFIDYGNESEVSKQDIMGPLPIELRYPIHANKCQIRDYANIDAFAVKILSSPIIKCKVVKEDDIVYITPLK